MLKNLLLSIALVFIASKSIAANRVVNLHVAYKTVHFAGKPRQAIAVNNQIPAPSLHFKEGDDVTINVYNHLDKETAVHWHGLLVPWQMDGVLGVTQSGIKPGTMFKYQFSIQQSGTYWYHAHAGLQEQRGLYGAFIIDPKKPLPYFYNKDHAIVLSDWSNTYPDQILANLKKQGEYYSPRFPLQPSLTRFISEYRKSSNNEKKLLFSDYMMMQQMRMGLYDISDIAYDAFLLNGHPASHPWNTKVKVGDVVRLRFIGAGASTIFKVKIPEYEMKMVHVQGNDVVPYIVNDFTVAPGETYDVLIKIKKNKPVIIYAESSDTLGSVYGVLTSESNKLIHFNNLKPFSEPLPVTREMMYFMMQHHEQKNMHHDKAMATPKHRNHMAKATTPAGMEMPDHHAQPAKTNIPADMAMPDHHAQPAKTNMPADMEMPDHHAQPAKTNMPADMEMPDHHSQPVKTNMPSDMEMPDHHVQPVKTNMPADMAMPDQHAQQMKMPTESSIVGDKISAGMHSYITSYGTKYQSVKARVKTNNPDKPIAGEIKMELFGYMDHYVWFINGIPGYLAKPIILQPGKRYRIVFTNPSMMHHPMHIHGHWFILRKGNGAYDPLLHTIDVPPGATITADLDTDASGQWFFHCHFLYHMMADMSRVIQYSSIIEISKNEAKPQDIIKPTAFYNRPIVRVDESRPINQALIRHPMGHPQSLWLATFLDIGADPFNNKQLITYKGLYGSDYNKLELFVNDAEINKGIIDNADVDIFYWRLISQFWSVKGGVNYFYRPASSPYIQPGIGIEGLMPYFIDTDIRAYYYAGSLKLDMELLRNTQITNNFFIRLGARAILASRTDNRAAIGVGLNQTQFIIRPYYRLMPGIDIYIEYENEKNHGVFASIQKNNGEAVIQNIYTLGLSVIF